MVSRSGHMVFLKANLWAKMLIKQLKKIKWLRITETSYFFVACKSFETNQASARSRGRVDGSQSEGPRFDPHVC